VLGELLKEVLSFLVLEGLLEVRVILGELVSEGSLEAVDEELGSLLVLQLLSLLLWGESFEGAVWNELDEESNDKHGGGKGEALDVVVHGELDAADWGATEFNEDHLDHDGQEGDHDEEWVVEEAGEDVEFVL